MSAGGGVAPTGLIYMALSSWGEREGSAMVGKVGLGYVQGGRNEVSMQQ